MPTQQTLQEALDDLRRKVERMLADARASERNRVVARIRDRALWHRERAVIEDSLGFQAARAKHEERASTLAEAADLIEREGTWAKS